MPPTLILVRHAQALHNVNKDYDIPDPDLSVLGLQQLEALRKSLMENSLAQNAGLIITSPMRRTIQTALGSVDWLMDKGIKLEADANWQENSAKPCDTGTPAPLLGAEFPSVDLSSLDPIYPDKTTPAGARYSYTKKAILNRSQTALKRLYDRPEKVIIVVSHSGFLRLGVSGCCFFNADYRIFDFSERNSPEDAYKLAQRQETEEKGGGLGWSLKKEVMLGSDLPDEMPEIDA
ncbi:histidine phosphatase superfamily [Pseudomassariella vexata]|uniref:Histidine phosphatase superfamily n=1 Tax=Pseudomassariella vexata TaxID=1141098 RepID=A0A1Y2D6S0_9PEZI|nr:histidine phosphatase superfamily [Pseudomassariella vexata]ORY54983.1 histidine phosphatase superfamily [Pseudomassariella vexata]